MDQNQRARALAAGEVVAPGRALTRQYLEVLRPVFTETGEPTVARVVGGAGTGRWDFYFDLADGCSGKEPFSLVVSVRENPDGDLEVSGTWVEALFFVYLTIWSDSICPDEIGRVTGLTATRSWKKGEAVGRGKSERRYDRSGWKLEFQQDEPGSLDGKLETLRENVGGSTAAIASLSPSCEIRLSIVVYDWAGQQHHGIHLDRETTRWIASMGAEVDISVYSSGPPFPDC